MGVKNDQISLKNDAKIHIKIIVSNCVANLLQMTIKYFKL
jgi:hypothetical protein